MDVPSINTWILMLGGLLMVVAVSTWRSKKKQNMPPGPKGWPIVGNLLQLGTQPHRTLHSLSKKYGPVMHLRMGSRHAVFISSSDHAKHFFKHNDHVFANRLPMLIGEVMYYGHKPLSLSQYGEYWRMTRKLCTLQLLSQNRVSSFKGMRESETELMVREIWTKSNRGTVAVDLSAAMCTFLTNTIWLMLSGEKWKEDEVVYQEFTFRELSHEISNAASVGNIGDYIPWLSFIDLQGLKKRLQRLHVAVDSVFERTLVEHEKKIGRNDCQVPTDLVDVLLEIHKENPLVYKRDNIKAIILDMFVGSSETTMATLEWAMSLLMKNPHTMSRLQDEIEKVVGRNEKVKDEHLVKVKYLHCVMKESLRLYPSIPLGGPHMSSEDANVCGYDLPKGSLVMVNIWALGRNENEWEDAEEFKPERFMNEEGESLDITGQRDMKMLPFGYGRRGCPGTPLAIPTVLLTIATLAHSFDWTIKGSLDMGEKFGIGLQKEQPLFAIPSSRVTWLE